MRLSPAAAFLVCALFAAPLPARDIAVPVPAHGVIGVGDAQLTAQFWIDRQAHPDRVILDATAIAAQNARLLRQDPSLHDLRGLGPTLTGAQIRGWIETLSRVPTTTLYDTDGQPVTAAALEALRNNLDLAAIPGQQAARYGLVVQRAALRTFPDARPVFRAPGDTDIDRFQESALFPGTPVLIAHASRDGDWLFVVSPRYAAWIDTRQVAEGPPAQVFGYVERTPYRIISAASARTVFTPAPAALSQLPLDMGVRVPVLADWPADQPVNGQHPYTAHVIQLPLRTDTGALRLAPALLPKSADSAAAELPLTTANLLRQGFKFLGERYGWGHAYDGRDCSGFVSDVYRSLGVQLPRNTGAQATSPALDRLTFSATTDPAARLAAVRAAHVGDLIYVPGHVMMLIGHIDGAPYVIHDTPAIRYRHADGAVVRVGLNAVSVSPLLPLLGDDGQAYLDRMTSIVRIRP